MEYALYVLLAYVLYTFTMMLIDSTRSDKEEEIEPGMLQMENSDILKPKQKDNFKKEQNSDNRVKSALLEEEDEILTNEDIISNEMENNFAPKEQDHVDLNEEIQDNTDDDNPFNDNLVEISKENEENAKKVIEENEKNSDLKDSSNSKTEFEHIDFEQNIDINEWDVKLKLEEARSIKVSRF